jgi:tRNA (mo5U34)-methyltransferase
MNKEEIQAGVDAVPYWYHVIEFPYGITTPGADRNPGSEARWQAWEQYLPPLKGKTVLDIGSWDGFYAFRAEKEGAKVLATDYFMWGGPGWGSKEGFDFAKLAFNSHVDELFIDVPDICEETVGKHDIVFFLNVLYHLESPYTTFEKLATASSNWIVIETIIDNRIEDIPYFRFVPDHILGDTTNWFIPNDLAVMSMIDKFGFNLIHKSPVVSGPHYEIEKLSRMYYIANRGIQEKWML